MAFGVPQLLRHLNVVFDVRLNDVRYGSFYLGSASTHCECGVPDFCDADWYGQDRLLRD